MLTLSMDLSTNSTFETSVEPDQGNRNATSWQQGWMDGHTHTHHIRNKTQASVKLELSQAPTLGAHLGERDDHFHLISSFPISHFSFPRS